MGNIITPQPGDIRGWSPSTASFITNFTRAEFACKCGCGFNDIDIRVVRACQQLRNFLTNKYGRNIPIRVNSGCRCEAHNRRVGSSSTNHVRGRAADIACSLGHITMFNEAKVLYKQFNQLQDMDLILLEGSFLHMDCNGKRRNGVFQSK